MEDHCSSNHCRSFPTLATKAALLKPQRKTTYISPQERPVYLENVINDHNRQNLGGK